MKHPHRLIPTLRCGRRLVEYASVAGRSRVDRGAIVALGLVVGACGCGGQSDMEASAGSRRAAVQATPTATPTGQAPPTITSPRDGSRTRSRFVVVRATVPRAPKGAYRNVRLLANRWFTD